MKGIFIIIGSASSNSANLKLAEYIKEKLEPELKVKIFHELKSLPHFDPELSTDAPPKSIVDFRREIENADAILISTPEYVFSIPAGLKNAIEWCVSTTIFSDKPTALLTASSDGKKGHEELQLIMKTLMAQLSEETTLLISGVKGKIDSKGLITDEQTKKLLNAFIEHFRNTLRF